MTVFLSVANGGILVKCGLNSYEFFFTNYVIDWVNLPFFWGSGVCVGVEWSPTETEVLGLILGVDWNLFTIFQSSRRFSASVSATLTLGVTGFSIFLSFLYNLSSQRLSFLPSSSLLFLCVQAVQSILMFFLYLCSLSTWHCWNRASMPNCCFVGQ